MRGLPQLEQHFLEAMLQDYDNVNLPSDQVRLATCSPTACSSHTTDSIGTDSLRSLPTSIDLQLCVCYIPFRESHHTCRLNWKGTPVVARESKAPSSLGQAETNMESESSSSNVQVRCSVACVNRAYNPLLSQHDKCFILKNAAISHR